MHSSSLLLRRLGLTVITLWLVGSTSAQTMEEQVREAVDRLPHPQSPAEFQAAPALPCLCQGNTQICWSFATCSFLESEMARLKLPSVRLSVIYPAYCQYVEKARQFVRTRGKSRFAPGGLFSGVLDTCRQYGAMPASVYEELPGSKAFDHSRLYAELGDYMLEVRLRGRWDERRVLAHVKAILNRHLGEPPQSFRFNGKDYTPKSFLAEVVRLPWSEYLMVTSFESAPFNTFTELEVPDNWRHNTNFFNVPLPVFYEAFKGALRGGFTVAVSMDDTEPSYRTTARYCVIPEFDLPAGDVTQAARELRFRDGATDDDHAIHIIGWGKVGGEDWFLAKDSGKGAWRLGNQGEVFLHGDYVKLKVLAFIVHRDGVTQVTALLPPSSRRQ